MIECTRISIETFALYSDLLTQKMHELKLTLVYKRIGKIMRLSDQKVKNSLFNTDSVIKEHQAIYVWFYVQSSQAKQILEALLHQCGLDSPGRATCTLSHVSLYGDHDLLTDLLVPIEHLPQSPPVITTSQLMGIHCIVPRGLGSLVANAALELGACVPVSWYATGMGFRDRLGLLRIALKAEKEIVQLVVPDHDTPGVLETIITEAKLSQPGRGFISVFSIEEGIVNSKTTEGKQVHLASMEQIIHAIDSREGNTLWRRKFDQNSNSKFKYGKDLMSISLFTLEGIGADASKAAMDIGAPGATGSLVQALTNLDGIEIEPAQEETIVVCSRPYAQSYLQVMLEKAQEADPLAIIELQSRPLAYVYSS